MSTRAWTPEEDAAFRAAADGAAETPTYRFAPFADFATHRFPDAEPLLGERGSIFLARGSFLLVYGGDGAGKSTWTIDAACHLAAGRDWLGRATKASIMVLSSGSRAASPVLADAHAGDIGGDHVRAMRSIAPYLFG